MTKKEREQLKALSLEAFGSSSRWQKILAGQYAPLVQQQAIERPKSPNSEEKEIVTEEVPVTLNGSLQLKKIYPTVQEVVVYMQNMIKNQVNAVHNTQDTPNNSLLE